MCTHQRTQEQTEQRGGSGGTLACAPSAATTVAGGVTATSSQTQYCIDRLKHPRLPTIYPGGLGNTRTCDYFNSRGICALACIVLDIIVGCLGDSGRFESAFSPTTNLGSRARRARQPKKIVLVAFVGLPVGHTRPPRVWKQRYSISLVSSLRAMPRPAIVDRASGLADLCGGCHGARHI